MVRLLQRAFKNNASRLTSSRCRTIAHQVGTLTDQVIKFFIVFFVVVEPLSVAPVFVSLTANATPQYQRRTALKAVAIAAAILLTFSLIGKRSWRRWASAFRRSASSVASCCS